MWSYNANYNIKTTPATTTDDVGLFLNQQHVQQHMMLVISNQQNL